jgi:hypothetical protein
MPEAHSAHDSGPKTPGAAALVGPPASPVARDRSRAMKIITPLVLFGLGVVLLVLAVVLYPSAATEVPGPAPVVPTLVISSRVPIAPIEYRVIPASSGRTKVEILMGQDPLAPRSRFRTVSVGLITYPGPEVAADATFGHSRSAVATVHFTVHVPNFGMRFNGITASVAIPSIYYTGPGTPVMEVHYPIPSASSYDWSAFPTTAVSNSLALWTIVTTKSDSGGQARASTPGQVAIGINHARQAADSNKTFVAGALLGLAGGAILSAVQEALHARD